MCANFDKLYSNLPKRAGEKYSWKNLYGASKALFLAEFLRLNQKPVLIITRDIAEAYNLQRELKIFLSKESACPILHFANLETLPYDLFSPHEDIISARLATLYHLTKMQKGVVIVAVGTLMQYLPPSYYLQQNTFILKNGDKLKQDDFRFDMERRGYRFVAEVMEHGEFTVRGSILDIFPMGSKAPFRIDLYGDEVDSIRIFDPETQLSKAKIETINILPAKEFPLTKEYITNFRQRWRETFSGDPSICSIYQNISCGESAPGIEYYLKLFFGDLATLFSYLPENSLIFSFANIKKHAEDFWREIKERYDAMQHDKERPLLLPQDVFLNPNELFANLNAFPKIEICEAEESALPSLIVEHRAAKPLGKVEDFLREKDTRFLFCAESLGRRESLLSLFFANDIRPKIYLNWHEFCEDQAKIGIIIASLEKGALVKDWRGNGAIAIITEAELFGAHTIKARKAKSVIKDPEAMVRNLAELKAGSLIVHIERGVGRYLGLKKIKTEREENEFLELEYAENTKLYVPVTSLHLIRRYFGGSGAEPLSRLGSKQWDKAKKEAIKKVRDVAVELLNIYAKRAAKPGFAYKVIQQEYDKFASLFPFEETEDQKRAIEETLSDMTKPKAMDRLICGDVGFGKTEVAMRAAFLAVNCGKQVALLSPTTILTEQHYQNFLDRFADWPITIEKISRFQGAKEESQIIEKLKHGKIDIIIGTHKILQPDIVFKDLGLLIIDEEHRFGVNQKERIKKMRPDIDILTLTATPIPRTLNMALSGIRDFSIIATPPGGRLAIKTFVVERNDKIIRESILREIYRGGQVFFLHNDIATIEKIASDLSSLVEEAKVRIGHGQMREKELEKIMSDFYHRRFNVLLCTTIIESGIDIPTANTIIINRADRFGLAELHQLRGRVGRSHHQAYAYLLTPPKKLITEDAKRRLEAFASMEDLGAGFVLATHDLEIRGAGELLGENQSGAISSIGFDLYMEYLERAVKLLQEGKNLDLDMEDIPKEIEIDLQIPAFIPDHYISDVNVRLTLYKRISGALDKGALENLQVEMIDRFGVLTQEIKNLFAATEIKFLAKDLGVRKIVAGLNNGSIEFAKDPKIDAKKIIFLIQRYPQEYKIRGSEKLDFKKQHKTVDDMIAFLHWLFAEISV